MPREQSQVWARDVSGHASRPPGPEHTFRGRGGDEVSVDLHSPRPGRSTTSAEDFVQLLKRIMESANPRAAPEMEPHAIDGLELVERHGANVDALAGLPIQGLELC